MAMTVGIKICDQQILELFPLPVGRIMMANQSDFPSPYIENINYQNQT
jgi:hypothetical protein